MQQNNLQISYENWQVLMHLLLLVFYQKGQKPTEAF